MTQAPKDILETGGGAEGGRFLWRYLIWGAGLFMVLIGLFFLWNSRGPSQQVKYRTQQVKQGDLVVTVSATGTLQPTNQVDVGSEISGTIRTVEVDYNDRVKKGQILARIDTSKLEAQIQQTEASLKAAQAHLLQAQATVFEARARLERLLETQKATEGRAPSKLDMDAARASLERALADEASAKASIAQAQATLLAQKTDLFKSMIRSPIDGVVLKRSAEPGQTVAATFQTPILFTLAEDLTQMELHVDVDEADVGRVHEGQQAVFTVDAYSNKTFPALVKQVRLGSKTVSGVVTYETILTVDNREMSLRPGMTATANITVARVQNALLVPNAALRFNPPVMQAKTEKRGLVGYLLPKPPTSKKAQSIEQDKRPHVWVLKDNMPVRVNVEAGFTDGIFTEVRGGELRPGMEVIVDLLEAQNSRV